MSTTVAQTTQVYQVFIHASPERVWEAITSPDFTSRYFYGTHVQIAQERYRSTDGEGNEMVVGQMFEIDPPRRLVHGWRALYDPSTAAEPESRVTWEIESRKSGVCLLTVTHDRLENAPRTAENVAGPGWMFVLSGLKTLLETGQPLEG